MPGLDSSFLKAKRKAAEAAEERSFETEVFREISRLAAGPSSAFEVGPTSHHILVGKSLSPESMQGRLLHQNVKFNDRNWEIALDTVA